MKNIRNIITTVAVLLSVTGTTHATTVKNHLPNDTVNGFTEPLTVNFLGEDENYLYFQVAVAAGMNRTVYFEVNDKVEGELYSTSFRNDKVQTYKIEKREGQVLDFSLQAGKKVFSKSFSNLKRGNLASL